MNMRIKPRSDGSIRVALYARTYDDDWGKSGSVYSSYMQLRELEAYCISKGWDIVGRFVDGDHSGGNTDRPGYKEMMASIDEWDILIVMAIDRVHRNSDNFKEMMHALTENQKKFISLREEYDTSTAMGRFVIDMAIRTAQLECELHDERACKDGIRIDLRRAGGKVFDILPDENDEYHAVIDFLDRPVTINISSTFLTDDNRMKRMVEVEIDGRGEEWGMEDNEHMGSAITEIVWLWGTGTAVGGNSKEKKFFVDEEDSIPPLVIDLKYIGDVKFFPPDDVDASRFVRSERFDCYGRTLEITVSERPTKECSSEGYFSIQLAIIGWKTINEKVNTSDIGVSLNEDGIKKAVQFVWDKWWKAGVIWY